MKISVLKSKIHRAVITQAELDYIGSITIDEDLMDVAGICEYEHVHIVNVNSGSRIETYVIAGERGSGVICLNGAAARSGQKGDRIIIMSYADMSPEEIKDNPPKVVFVDDNNKIIRTARYEKHGRLEDNKEEVSETGRNLLCKNPVEDKREILGNPENWKMFTTEGASAVFNHSGNSTTIFIERTGKLPAYFFRIQGRYTGIKLKANKRYRIEFDYRSSANMYFQFAVLNDYYSYRCYYTATLESYKEKQHYFGDFTMFGSDDNVSVTFACCNGLIKKPYSITFENISLTEYE